jgi:ribose 5-phosphate isomerase A
MKKSSDLDHLKGLGQYALRYVKAGQTIGLGTGRAASAFITALGASGIKVRGVATSHASADLARSLNVELVELSEAPMLATDFDGADEVDPRLNMIKGLGGAMVRERVVAAASRKRIFLVGEEKLVKRLGQHGNLPVEAVPFAAAFVQRQIATLGLKAELRKDANGTNIISDNGNLIFDCAVREVRNPSRLDRDLLMIPGVVGTGLFTGIADLVLVALHDGTIKTLRHAR